MIDSNVEKQPYVSDITKEAESIKRQLRSMVIALGYIIENVANELKERYGSRESKNNLSNKLLRGTLRYIDVKRICDILGYKIEMVAPECR